MVADGDATGAYRGYRRQALYTLYRILTGNIAKFQPEGREDLAIFQDIEHLSEIVQVKSLSRPIVLSDLDPHKKDGFFSRLAREAPFPQSVEIRLVSYGPVGPELQQAIGFDAPRKQHVAQKIHEANSAISIEIAIHLLERIVIEEVEEVVLIERVHTILRQLCTGVDPEKAFDLMTAWLYKGAEAKLAVTQIELVEQIGTIGKFLTETATYLREWGTAIIPIESADVAPDRLERLSDEFYSGTLTRYEHIKANLDVLRPDQIETIAAKFVDRTVVVVHGASGQGKTTLAYRFLHEQFPAYCRYQVRRIEGVSHALSIATAIATHARGLHLPIAFFLDVAPGDSAWTEVARQLVAEPNVKLLVTIREEDWRRAALPDEAEAFADVPLTFDEGEGQSIYNALTEHTPSIHFLSFADAWVAFGEGGPLMEFVHLLTQGTTLRQRLAKQVQRIQDEVLDQRRDRHDLDVLRLVSVAAGCDARLQVDALASHLQLSVPERTLQRLEREYLLFMSEEESLVGGLHPLRSHILAELLTTSTIMSWSHSAVECLPLLYEADIQAFLFAALVTHREDASVLVAALMTWQPSTWTGIVGVTRGLLWLGVAEYVDENRELLLEVHQEVGAGIMFALEYDIADVLPQGMTGLFDKLVSEWGTQTEEQRQRLHGFRARQTDKTQIYQQVTAWLGNRIVAPQTPSESTEWLAAAEVVFWLGHLQIEWPLDDWLPLSLLGTTMSSLPLETLADVVLGFANGYGRNFSSWYVQHREPLLTRFRQETLSVRVEDNGTLVVTHYILVQGEKSTSTNLRIRDPHNAIHNTAMQRIWLLRRLVPDREEYGCQGRGHHLGSLELASDDSMKSAIPHRSLHPYWLTAHNGLFRSIVKSLFRLSTWQDYTNSVLTIRQQVVQTLAQLTSSVETYFRNQSMVPILNDSFTPDMWDSCRKSVAVVPPLPQCAVDAWGLVDEETASDGRPAEANSAVDALHPAIIRRRWLALERYTPFLKVWSGYTKELEWFFQHGVQLLSMNIVLGRQAKTRAEGQQVRQAAQNMGLDPNTAPRQSMFHLIQAAKYLPKLQLEFRLLFDKLVSTTTLQSLEHSEQAVLDDLLALWRWFAFAPHVINHLPLLHSQKQLEDVATKCQHQIHKGLQRLSTNHMQLSIRTGVTWNQESVLCIVVDGNQALQLFQAFQPTVEVVHRVLHSVSDHDVTRYGLTRWWEHLVIVPLLDGKRLSSLVWHITTPVLLCCDSFADLKWWNLMQHELLRDTVASLGLTEWNQVDQYNVMKLGEEVLGLRFIVAHLQDIQHLPDLDTEGYEIARHYLQDFQEKLSKQLQTVINAIAWMTEFVNRVSELPQLDKQALETMSEGLQSLATDVLPTPDFSKEAEIPLAMMDPWLTRLETAATTVLLLQTFALDIIVLHSLDSKEGTA